MTAAEDFKAALMGLRQAAGSTVYKTLVSYARGQRVSLTSSSLSDWFTGKSIPSDAAALRVVVTCLASRANMSPAQRAECCSQLERLREAAWKERHLLPVPAPPPLRGDLFAAGSGVGSKIIMAPLFGSPFDPASLLEQFIDSLLAVGLDEGNVAPFRAVVDGFLLATSRDEAADLLDAYNSAMWNVDTLVREHCAAGEFTWFALGQMLFQIAYQGTYAGTSRVVIEVSATSATPYFTSPTAWSFRPHSGVNCNGSHGCLSNRPWTATWWKRRAGLRG